MAKQTELTVNSVYQKSQNEILRSINELSKIYSERVISFFLHRIEQTSEINRICSLLAFKHIINSNEDELKNKKQIILSGLRILLQEKNNKVKKQLLQTIISMGYHDYLNLESGNLFIEFLLKQCSISDAEIKEV